MKKENFESLKESIIEAGKIMRGEIPPSREFIYEVDSSEIKEPVDAWAVCVDTDDEDLLIPGKIYRVKILSRGFWVLDEEGEAALCPQDFFVTISLPAEVSEKLSELKKAA